MNAQAAAGRADYKKKPTPDPIVAPISSPESSSNFLSARGLKHWAGNPMSRAAQSAPTMGRDRPGDRKMPTHNLPAEIEVRVAAIDDTAVITTDQWTDDAVVSLVTRGLHECLTNCFAGFGKMNAEAQSKARKAYAKMIENLSAGEYRFAGGGRKADELSAEIRAMATAAWRKAGKALKELNDLRDLSGENAVREYVAVMYALKHGVRPDTAIRDVVTNSFADEHREKIEAAARSVIAQRTGGIELSI